MLQPGLKKCKNSTHGLRMARSSRILPVQPEDLTLDLSNKKLSMARAHLQPGAVEVRDRRITGSCWLESNQNQTKTHTSFRIKNRTCLKRIDGLLWLLCVHTGMQTIYSSAHKPYTLTQTQATQIIQSRPSLKL